MILRKASKKDQAFIYDLVRKVLSEYNLRTNPQETDKDLSDLDQYYFHNNGWFAVIENDGKIIGSYGIFKLSETSCELRKMYLYKEYQGKGLGKKMMDEALQVARNLGYMEMCLETNKVLNKALDLYLKYGFNKAIPDHLSDRCDISMIKKL